VRRELETGRQGDEGTGRQGDRAIRPAWCALLCMVRRDPVGGVRRLPVGKGAPKGGARLEPGVPRVCAVIRSACCAVIRFACCAVIR
jgi:hypothetical protein